MRISKWLAGVTISGLVVAGTACSPKKKIQAESDSVVLVPVSERSTHFATVTEKLELGGTVFGYVDIDGDVLRLATALQQLAAQAVASQPMAAAFVPEDFVPFFEDLGLADVKALGLSSVKDAGGGFRNRVFLYAPNGRRGLLAGLGGPSAPFKVASLAPADADLVFETELDVATVYAALRGVIVRAAGEPVAKMMETKLREADPGTGIVPLDVLKRAKGRVSVVLRIDETRTFEPKPGVVVPVFDVSVRVEGMGTVVDALARATPMLVRVKTAENTPVVYSLAAEIPDSPWQPELRIEGDVASFSSSQMMRVAAGTASLADEPGFKGALAELGNEGNGLTYVSSGFGRKARRVLELNPALPPESRQVVERVLGLLPADGVALVAVRQNLPDGVLWSSHWNSSLKASLVFANPGVLVGTGMTAAMAIPAFQKVRSSSQEKAVLNNLRQLSAARDQFFLETGRDECSYTDLVGPKAFILKITPVAGEDYGALRFRLGESLRVTLSDGREVHYE